MSAGPSDDNPQRSRSLPWAVLALVVVAWFGLWYLTPNMLSDGFGAMFSDDRDTAVTIESVTAFVLVLALAMLHRRYSGELFALSWTVCLYAIPIVAGAILPFHYSRDYSVALYLFAMAASVLWQNFLTFGLLQKYLAERLPTWAVLVTTAIVFWAGHALYLPASFAPDNLAPSIAILALGFVLGGFRLWLRTLHLPLALHLGFYYIVG